MIGRGRFLRRRHFESAHDLVELAERASRWLSVQERRRRISSALDGPEYRTEYSGRFCSLRKACHEDWPTVSPFLLLGATDNSPYFVRSSESETYRYAGYQSAKCIRCTECTIPWPPCFAIRFPYFARFRLEFLLVSCDIHIAGSE